MKYQNIFFFRTYFTQKIQQYFLYLLIHSVSVIVCEAKIFNSLPLKCSQFEAANKLVIRYDLIWWDCITCSILMSDLWMLLHISHLLCVTHIRYPIRYVKCICDFFSLTKLFYQIFKIFEQLSFIVDFLICFRFVLTM